MTLPCQVCFLLCTCAGFPHTVTPSGTSLVTTAPAPTREPLPIVIPGRIVAPAPITAPFLTNVCVHPPRPDGGYLSFVKVTRGPMKQLSSIITPFGMNANACTFTLLPMCTFSPIQTWE